jgi:hypothetical protein
MNEITFTDLVNMELDRRKIQKLIDDGIISDEQLMSAPIIRLVCPNDPKHGLTEDATRCVVCDVEPIVSETP